MNKHTKDFLFVILLEVVFVAMSEFHDEQRLAMYVLAGLYALSLVNEWTQKEKAMLNGMLDEIKKTNPFRKPRG